MDNMDLFPSQESLPLSQESFSYLWPDLGETNIDKLPDEAELTNLLNDAEVWKMEDEEFDNERPSEQIIIPPSTSAEVMPYTKVLIAPKNALVAEEQPDVDDDFAEKTEPQMNHSNIPPCTNWPGEYNFEISFPAQEKTSKSTSWTYSEIKEKLFVDRGVACPVNFHIKIMPPYGSVIRTMAIFSKPEHITDVVKRCINHSSSSDPLNDGHPAFTHLVRCDNSLSQYVEDEITKRHSVVTPYENPQAGMEYTTYLYRFMCLGSCVGGPNRRPLKLIFTLEKDGHCLGRKVIDLRICACPGRDKKTEEKRLEKQQLKRSSSNADEPLGPLLKKQKPESGDEQSSYTLTVHGRSLYEFFKKIRDALEISSMLTPEEAAAFRKRHAKTRSRSKREAQYSSEESST